MLDSSFSGFILFIRNRFYWQLDYDDKNSSLDFSKALWSSILFNPQNHVLRWFKTLVSSEQRGQD